MFEKQEKVDFLDKVIIKRTNRKKTISISIRNDTVTLLSPKLISKNYLYNILLKKKKWITKKLNEQKKRPKSLKNKFVRGESFFKFGIKKTLIYRKSSLEEVIEKENSIEVHCLSETSIKKKLECWLKVEVESYINSKLESYKNIMKVDYDNFKVKSFKRRLGSCSNNKKLSFNWKIVMMPKEVINYIIIHELSHLVHFNHSKSFWKLVARFCPDYKEQKEWIKQNEHLIL